MPTYACKCSKCGIEQDYYAKIADRDITPKCDVCKGKTVKMLSTPMISAMGLTSGSFQVKSPIDGQVIHGRSEYFAHMKKHGVVPESDLKGESERVKKQQAKDQAQARRATIEKVFHTTKP